MNSNRAIGFFLAIAISVLLVPMAQAQGDPVAPTLAEEQLGSQAYGSYHGGDIDSIGLTNGALSLNFPILAYPQLGKLQLSFNLMYNTSRQHFAITQRQYFPQYAPGYCSRDQSGSSDVKTAGGSKSKNPGGNTLFKFPPNETVTYDCWDWKYVRGVSAFPMENSDVFVGLAQQWAVVGQPLPFTWSSGCFGNSITDLYAAWFVQSADGSRHLLGNEGGTQWTQAACAEYGVPNEAYETQDGPFETLDTTGWYVSGKFSSFPYPGVVVPDSMISPDGMVISGSGSTMTDANSNSMSFIQTGSASWAIMDSLGRNITLPMTHLSATDPAPSGCPSGTTGTTWSPPGYGDAATTYKFCYAPVTTDSLGPPEDEWATNQGGDTVINQVGVDNPLLQSIILPNGQSWQFAYGDNDKNGHYGTLTQITLPTGGTITYAYTSVAGNILCQNGGRWVASRTVNANDGTGDHRWTYHYGSVGKTFATTVTDPSGNATVHLFGLSDSNCPAYETLTQYYQGAAKPGNLIKSVATTYSYSTVSLSTQTNNWMLVDVVPTNIVTTLSGSGGSTATASTVKTYDAGFTTNSGSHTFGKETKEKVFDYNSSTPLRITDTTYQFQSNPSYLGANLINLVSYADVLFGTQPLTSTTYTYDEPAYELATNGGLHGNVTSVSRPAPGGYAANLNCPTVSASGNVVTHRYYNKNGTVSEALDACVQPTTYGYESTSVYPTSVTNALGYTSQFQYDATTNVLTWAKDPNGLTTTYSYDPTSRPIGATKPDGGQITLTYTSPCSAGSPCQVTKTATVTPFLSKSSTSTFDGLGRPWQSVLTSDPDGSTSTETQFGWANPGGVGRTECTWNPTRSGSGLGGLCNGPGVGYTFKQYDALGRISSITYPNTTDAVSTSYNLNCQTVTDEAGRKRSSCSDALGRLTCVIEDPGGVTGGFTTTYSYDVLGNLTAVNQFGSLQPCNTTSGASRTRSFSYDTLSRMTQTYNPESGTVNYWYDANGNVEYRRDACNQVGYYVDRLNRLIRKWSDLSGSQGSGCTNSADISVSYLYDTFDPNQPSPSGPSIGLRTAMYDVDSPTYAQGYTFFNYDSMKRPTLVQRTTSVPGQYPSPSLSATYAYNYDGSVNQITYPSGRQLNYTLASGANGTAGRDGMLWRIDPNSSLPVTYVSGATYAPDGQLSQMPFGGQCGGGEYMNYDQRLRPLHLLYTTNASTAGTELGAQSCTTNTGDLMHKFYSYSGGDVQRVANCLNNDRSQNFHYDSLDRINWAWTDGVADGWSEQYTIDPWGNLTNIGPYNGNIYYESMAEAPANAQNQLNLGAGFYDPVGNQIASVGTSLLTFAYDGENRLQSVNGTNVTYAYDGDGERTMKNLGGSGTLYWRGPDGNTLAESDLTGAISAEYLYFDGKRLARVDNPTSTSPTMEFYFEDHLGSTSMVMASTLAQPPAQDTDFYPFGGIAYQSGSDSNHYKFTGKERDNGDGETGNDYFGARHYANAIARFISPDGGADQDTREPQSWNLYSYVHSNPLSGTDPDGRTVSICDSNGGNCQNVSDKDYAQAQQRDQYNHAASLDQLKENSGSLSNITDSNGNIVGTVMHNYDENAPAEGISPGLLGPGDIALLSQLRMPSFVGEVVGKVLGSILATGVESAGAGVEEILAKASSTVGNQAIEAASRGAAEEAAEKWVGDGARAIFSEGEQVGWKSADGTKIVRFTSAGKQEPYINLSNNLTGGNLHVHF